MGWFEFIAVSAGFYVLHSVPVRRRCGPGWWAAGPCGLRDCLFDLVARNARRALRRGGPRALRAALARAPSGALAALAAMTAAGLILTFRLFRPNPLSFGGTRNPAFDPQNPGLLRWVRHPVLAAFFLWSGAHLVVTGTSPMW